jgi:sucrose synthase
LEKGWGDTAEMCNHIIMNKFFSSVSAIFNIGVFSLHDYFGQANVLGFPDTEDQVSISAMVMNICS